MATRRLSLACVLLGCSCLAGCATKLDQEVRRPGCSCLAGCATKLDQEVSRAIQGWERNLWGLYRRGATGRQIEAWLGDRVRDKHVLRSKGGHGGHTVYYLVDDLVEMELTMAGATDKLLAWDVRRKSLWLRHAPDQQDPAGRLVLLRTRRGPGGPTELPPRRFMSLDEFLKSGWGEPVGFGPHRRTGKGPKPSPNSQPQ